MGLEFTVAKLSKLRVQMCIAELGKLGKDRRGDWRFAVCTGIPRTATKKLGVPWITKTRIHNIL
jgi:hypothetical protein